MKIELDKMWKPRNCGFYLVKYKIKKTEDLSDFAVNKGLPEYEEPKMALVSIGGVYPFLIRETIKDIEHNKEIDFSVLDHAEVEWYKMEVKDFDEA